MRGMPRYRLNPRRRFAGHFYLVVACLGGGPLLAREDLAAHVDFNREIRPLLAKNCFACHGPDAEHREKDLRLDVEEQAHADRHGRFAIKPFDPARSEVIRRITNDDEGRRMPPPEVGHRLAAEDVKKLERWIAQGGKYEKHWAFVPPVKSTARSTRFDPLVRVDADRYVFELLDEKGLAPSPPADPYTLARRVSFDITGLPPSLDLASSFAADPSDAAYEKLVDSLLASPHYGERMARIWLDLARYADSAGYGSDPLRTIWRYRDYVIDAFNDDLPYDRFVTEQLAGDLLDHPTRNQILATAFHRNTLTNTEGGTDNEEFRVAAVKDRTNVTMQVFMGLTFGCAQCHSHKFDPITQQEYYSLFDFFNQTEDADRSDEEPRIATPSRQDEAEAARIERAIAEHEEAVAARGAALGDTFAALAEEDQRLVKSFVPQHPENYSITSISRYTVQPDDSILQDGDLPVRETMALRFQAPHPAMRSLALEALTHPSLPSGGPGSRGGNGNFVLNEIEVRALRAKMPIPSGRYVRIELPGADRILSLAEVEVIAGGENVARRGSARQSSTDFGGDASRAIDGNRDGAYEKDSVTHTRQGKDPWFEIDLKKSVAIDRVVIFNRMGGGLPERLRGAVVKILDESRTVKFEQTIATPPLPEVSIDTTRPYETVKIVRASTDFEQQEFGIASAIDHDLSENRGWAISPRQGESHVAVFELERPLDGPFEVVLTQNFGGYHVLGHFRLLGSETVVPHPLVSPRIAEILRKPSASRSREENAALVLHFAASDPEVVRLRSEITQLRSRLAPLTGVMTPIQRELPSNARRVSHVLAKGNFLDPMQEVHADVPSAFHGFPKDAPKNRLGLAAWIVDPKNPLTARVFVNRIYAMLFGAGIVFTEEDFGLQGSPPTNPALLDALAVDFVAHHYDIKWLVKELVMSYAYRQRSSATDEQLRVDPNDRLLERGPRFRLESEMVRDQALFVAGLLSPKMYGPPVYPPQPEGLWRAAFNGERSYATSEGEDRWRRGLYTVWRRTMPYPSMSTFDSPSRETCAIRRVRTNTPLQAFVTLNDPAYVECAQALARRLIREGGNTVEERVAYGLRLTLLAPPEPEAVAALVALHASELDHFGKDVSSALALATDPLGPLPDRIDPIEAAAYTVVANVLLNQDAFLTKD